jgi:phosphoserine phosphatase
MKIKRQKYIHQKDQAEAKQTIFCSECGEDLELFGVVDKNIDLKKVKERYHNCKEKGKFKGDKCAMLFIAEPNEDSDVDEVEN